MFTSEPRVQVPRGVAKGAIVPIKVLIDHPMETGFRKDEHGQAIPRKIINRFVCRYGDVEVFSADLHEAIAANPYFEFYIEATDSGVLEFLWEEDGGRFARLQHPIVVG
jgi:sulfur-oxidizing protein SoxZ